MKTNISHFRCGLAIVLVGLLLPVALWAQTSRGRITGVVKDASGAVIPNITVTATSQQTGIRFTGLTQANGTYLIPGVLPGDYNVSASAPGFKRLKIDNLKVDVDSTLTQDLLLEVGQVTESVEVTGQTSLVDTTSGAVGSTVQMKHVLEIPVADRNVFQLINLVPGAFAKHRWGPGETFIDQVSIGGSRGQSQLATIDGVSNTRGGIGVQNIEMMPPMDTVQEFKVQVNNMSAEYGRSSGGVVNSVTKSGSNALHGSLYEFLRNDAFDAKGWGNDTKPKLRRNTFGGTVGGKIKRDKTFFFAGYDGMRNYTGGTQVRNVGLAEWRTGDFSTATRDAGGRAAVVPVYDPETGAGTFGSPRNTAQFPGNKIPASRLDPVAVKMLAYMPLPNRTPNNPFDQSGNWGETALSRYVHNYYTGRVDHAIGANTKIYGRYIGSLPRSNSDGIPKGWPVGFNAGFGDDRVQNFALGGTHLFSPTFFVNFTAGAQRLHIATRGGNAQDGVNYPQLLGLPGVPGPGTPSMNFVGGLVPVGSFALGGGNDRFNNCTNWDYLIDFTKARGNHTYKFGGQYNRFNNNTMLKNNPGGNWTFDGHFTRGVDASGAYLANTGVNLGDYLLGRVTSVGITITPPHARRSQYYGLYFQDDWRVSSRLTLNLGIRWDTQNPTYEPANRFSNFDPYQVSPLAGTGDIPSGALGVVTYANKFGQGKYLWNWEKKGFMPRFGFAWRLFGTNETVLRGGYGIFFGSPLTNSTQDAGVLGFVQTYSVGNPVPFRLRDGLPAGALASPPESALTGGFGARGTTFEQAGLSFIDPYRAMPYTQNFNLTLQHQWKGILFEAGYIGNLGRHVSGYATNINRIRPELLSRTDIPERLKRPFTIFTGDRAAVTNSEDSVGMSNYHAFTFRSEHRFKSGLAWTVAYTHSKWIDNVSFQTASGTTLGDNSSYQFFYNRSLERSRATNDIPHRLVMAPVYELPFGKGKPWLKEGRVVNAITGGWQISANGTLQSGSPFGVTILNGGVNVLGDASATLRPDLLKNPNSASQGQPAVGIRGIQWLDPTAFATPARYTFGTGSRTLPGVTSPGMVIFDVLVAKSFSFLERYRAQFRAEMLDAFNTPIFGLPSTSLGGSGFGNVTTKQNAVECRRIMQFGLKLYF